MGREAGRAPQGRVCEGCRHFVLWAMGETASADGACAVEPRWVPVSKGHWCGQWKPAEGGAGGAAPVVHSLEPSSAVMGGPDLVLRVLGVGFTPATVILFNGGEEVTTYVSPTEVTTGVKPSLVGAPIAVPVGVVGAAGTVAFVFLAP